MLQNRQVMVTSFGCCWYSGGAPRASIVDAGEDGCRGMQGDSGIVIEDVCEDVMQNVGGRLVLMLMRAGILVGDVVVVAVGVMVVVYYYYFFFILIRLKTYLKAYKRIKNYLKIYK